MSITTSSLKRNLKNVLLIAPFVFTSWLATWLLAGAPDAEDFTRRRLQMVERQLRARGIEDPRVLEAMGVIPRHLFVSADQSHLAYTDGPRPIEAGQTISQPYIVALMTELLMLTGNEKVLEIGTGSGYQTAVLSRLARAVYTIEIIPTLTAKAKEILTRLGYRNIEFRTGDGFFGWEEKAPFEAVLVTAAAEQIPDRLWEQMAEGGRLVMPLGNPRGGQTLVRVRKVEGKRLVEKITGVVFVPMTGAAQDAPRH